MKTFKRILLYLLCLCIVIVFAYTYAFIRFDDGIAILGYHHVVSDAEKKEYYKHDIYVMGESDFEEQMKYLADHHYKTLTMDELYAYYEKKLEVPRNTVVLTFDDGLASFNDTIKPILEKYDLQATCFVIGKKTLKPSPKVAGKYSYLGKDELVDDDNVQYFSHTYNLHHKSFLFLKQMETVAYDTIVDDFQSNEGIVSSDYFAFPYGRTSSNAKKALHTQNVKLAFGYGENRKMIRGDDPYLLPRFIMYDFLTLQEFKWFID